MKKLFFNRTKGVVLLFSLLLMFSFSLSTVLATTIINDSGNSSFSSGIDTTGFDIWADNFYGNLEWEALLNVPTGLDDGDDDTTYSHVSNFSNDLGYWNDTYATFNKTYADTLYADLSTILSWDYYNASDFDINDYMLKSNTSFAGNISATVDFCIEDGTCLSNTGATETDPYWSANLTAHNATWSQDTTYTAGTNLSLSGTIFSANMTSLKGWFDLFYDPIGGGETDPLAYNGTLAYIADIISYEYFNSTFFPYTHLSNFTDDLVHTTDTDTWNTTEEMQDAVGSGINATLIYDDTNNILYVNWSNDPNTGGADTDTWNTTEEIVDAVLGQANISIIYNDAGDEWGVNFGNITITEEQISNFQTYLLQSNQSLNGNYSFSVDVCLDDNTCLSNSGGSPESDPFWSDNFTKYNTSWSTDTNTEYQDLFNFSNGPGYYNITNFDINDYRLKNNASFAENVSSDVDFCITNGNCLSNAGVGSGDITSVTSNNTYILDYGTGDSGDVTLAANLSQFNDSYIHVNEYPNLDTDSTDDFDGAFSSLTGGDSNVCGSTDKVVNVTFINGELLIVCDTDLTSGTETDPYWSANLTAHNATWNSIFNQTYEDAWQYVINATFLLQSNNTLQGNYSASVDFCIESGTCLSDVGSITDTDTWNTTEEMQDAVGAGINATLIYDDPNNILYVNLSHITITESQITDFGTYRTLANITFAENISSKIDFCIEDGVCLSNSGGSPETDPYWSGNLTAHNDTWSQDTDTDTWNTTEEMQDAVGGGINATLIYDDTNNILYVNWSNDPNTGGVDTDTWNTTEQMVDAVLSQANASIIYNDAGDEWGVNFSNITITEEQISNFQTYLLQSNQSLNGNYTFSVDVCLGDNTCLSNSGGSPETDPYWSANLTAHNATWNSIFNQTYEDAWQYVINATFLLQSNNTLQGNYSASVDFCIQDGSCLSDVSGIVDTDTWNTTEEMQDAVGAGINATLIYDDTNNILYVNQSNLSITEEQISNFGTYRTLANITFAENISSKVDFCIEDGTCLSNSGASPETDPYWSGNLTAHNATWNSIFNQTYEDAWQYVINATFLLQTNTTLKGNYSALVDFCIEDGTCLSNVGGIVDTDTWNTTEEMQDAVGAGINNTLIYDDTNNILYVNQSNLTLTEAQISDFQVYLLQSNQTFNGNYSATVDFCIAGGTCLSNAGGVETDPYWSANLTAHNATWSSTFNQTYEDAWQYTTNSTFAVLAEANTFTENQTTEGILLESDTTNHRIFDNATCVFITGDTSVLEVC